MKLFSSFALAAFAVLTIVGCNRPTTTAERYSPKPESISAETVGGVRYTFLMWDEGLRVMVADTCGGGGWRGWLTADDPGQPFVWCGTLNNPNNADCVLKWTIKSTDGIEGVFDINGELYDLKQGRVFLLSPTPNAIATKQLDLELADLEPTDEALSVFIMAHLTTEMLETD